MMEYGGFNYDQKMYGIDGETLIKKPYYMLYLEDRPWQRFETFDALCVFVDQVNRALNVALKDYHLHLTGCMRCKRTMDGGKFDPCERGKVLMGQGKGIALQIAQQFADARLASS